MIILSTLETEFFHSLGCLVEQILKCRYLEMRLFDMFLNLIIHWRIRISTLDLIVLVLDKQEILSCLDHFVHVHSLRIDWTFLVSNGG